MLRFCFAIQLWDFCELILRWRLVKHRAVGVFVAVLIFQFSISMSLIIVFVLLMVDLEVYGFVYVIGAKLNCKLGIICPFSLLAALCMNLITCHY